MRSKLLAQINPLLSQVRDILGEVQSWERLGSGEALKRYRAAHPDFAQHAIDIFKSLIHPTSAFVVWSKGALGEQKAESLIRIMEGHRVHNLLGGLDIWPDEPSHLISAEKSFPEHLKRAVATAKAQEAALTGAFKDLAPSSFQFAGFKVFNPDRISEDRVKGLLDGVTYAKALFKKAGIEDLLYGGIRAVHLHVDDKLNLGTETLSVLGWYSEQEIHLLARAQDTSNPRLMERWVDEVFVHEFGHYVHLHYLTPQARAFFDSSWQPVDDAQKDQAEFFVVTRAERDWFFNLLKRAQWDFAKVRLKGLDRIKYLAWLFRSKLSSSIKQVRLTPRALKAQAFLRDPEGFKEAEYLRNTFTPEEILVERASGRFGEDVERHKQMYLREMFLGESKTYDLVIPDDVHDKIRKDPSYRDDLVDSARKQVFREWGTPTDYAQTNVLEDFAESWVQFIAHPQTMPPKALYRMKRTLWLSGWGNKPVMRLGGRMSTRQGGHRHVERYQNLRAYWEFNSPAQRVYGVEDLEWDSVQGAGQITYRKRDDVWQVYYYHGEDRVKLAQFTASDERDGVKRALIMLHDHQRRINVRDMARVFLGGMSCGGGLDDT